MKLQDAIKNRRTYYHIDKNVKVSDQQIKDIVDFALLHTPSSFNSQSTRLVLLLGEKHEELWNIVKETLKKMLPPHVFINTEKKINSSFSSGYGTILFYEDEDAVAGLQKSFPLYADNFPVWSQHTSAMHQFVVWTLLEDIGLGASLQHYNPLIDEELISKFQINPKWKLIAQMPFGNPTKAPDEKSFTSLENRAIFLR